MGNWLMIWLKTPRRVRSVRLFIGILLSVCWVLVAGRPASAQLAAGEIQGSFSQGGSTKTFHAYIVFIDTGAKAFSPVVTSALYPCEPGAATLTPVYEWAERSGVFLAINGSFFDPESEFKPGDCRQVYGPVKSNSMTVAPSIPRPDKNGNPAILFSSDGTPQIKMATMVDVQKSRSAVAGQWEPGPSEGQNGSLLIEGNTLKGDTALPDAATVDPRTAVGLTSNGVLILIAVEGRVPDSDGITLPHLAWLLKAYGASNAINLDGGGSTTMTYAPGPGVPMRETMALYQVMKSTESSSGVTYTFTQRDPRIPFTTRPSDSVGSTGGGSQPIEYRPVAIQLGFKVGPLARPHPKR